MVSPLSALISDQMEYGATEVTKVSQKKSSDKCTPEQCFMNNFFTIKARDTIQTVLENTSNEKNPYSNIDLKLNDAWKFHGALENDFLVPRDLLFAKFRSSVYEI